MAFRGRRRQQRLEPGSQRACECAGARLTSGRFARQRLGEHRVDDGELGPPRRRERHRIGTTLAREHLVVLAERRLQREQRVCRRRNPNTSERGVASPPKIHLGRAVAGSARALDELAVAPGDADIDQHRAILERIADDVRGFDVAVDHAALVQRVERRCNLLDRRHQLGQRHRRAFDTMPSQRLLQSLAFDELHHEVRVAAGLSEVVDLDQMRMLDPREDRRFLAQALDEARILREIGRNILIATGRSSARSTARYTTPMPPRLIS